MPKWKKDETNFDVSVNNDGNGGYICRIPKPIVQKLGITTSIKFLLKKNNVVVEVGEK